MKLPPRFVHVLTLGVVTFLTSPLEAQTPVAPPTPTATARPTPIPPVLSPDVHPDQRVTFRLRAPNAKAVSVSGQFQKGALPMTKSPEGIWSVTIGPVASDIFEYSFSVDGVTMIDPGNAAIKPMRNPRTSILYLPGTPPRLHDFQDVPHGRVSLHSYTSKSLGRRRALQVYTPPGYDANASTRYPTLYLLHGSGDNEATWVAHGHVHWILDNLIADGRAQPMIVVMLDGHASSDRSANLAAFERDLLEDAMPLIVASYWTRVDAASRAIVGLSMGGGQSLTIGLKHPDRFAWVGGMSSSVGQAAELLGDGTTLNRHLKLLWFACGKDDFLLKPNQDLAAVMKARNIRHHYIETEGAHNWPVWRGYLADFLPLIFQPAKS